MNTLTKLSYCIEDAAIFLVEHRREDPDANEDETSLFHDWFLELWGQDMADAVLAAAKDRIRYDSNGRLV